MRIISSLGRLLTVPVAHACKHSNPTCCYVKDCHQFIACQNINIKELLPKHTWQPPVSTACSSMFCLLTWRIGCICFQTVLRAALNRISCTPPFFYFPLKDALGLYFPFICLFRGGSPFESYTNGNAGLKKEKNKSFPNLFKYSYKAAYTAQEHLRL